MEIRVLRYFLAVAREGSITGAAHFLHLTQPTLSPVDSTASCSARAPGKQNTVASSKASSIVHFFIIFLLHDPSTYW